MLCPDQQSAFMVVDLGTAGPRPAITDIAYLLITWSTVGDKKYPPLGTRRGFAQAYLEKLQQPHDDAAVNDLLWAVECEVPLQLVWLFLVLVLILTIAAKKHPETLAAIPF